MATPKRSVARRAAASFSPYALHAVGIAALILITAGLGVVNPVLVRSVFDDGLFPQSGGPGHRPALEARRHHGRVTALTGGLGIVQTWATNIVGQRVMRDLRDRLYIHLQRLSLGFFTGTRTGEIQSRIANDVGGIQNVVTNTLSSVMSNVVIVISTLVAMTVLSWQLAVVSVVTVPFFFLLSGFVGERRRRVTAEAQKAAAEVTAITHETLSISGIVLAKLFGRQNQEIERFHYENERMASLAIKRQMTGQSFFALMQIFFSLSPIAIYLIAGYMLTGQFALTVTSGTIVAFTTLQSRLYWPIGSLMRVSVELRSSLALFERIFGYLDIEPDIEDRAQRRIDQSPRRRGPRELRVGKNVLHARAPKRFWYCCGWLKRRSADGVSLEIHRARPRLSLVPAGLARRRSHTSYHACTTLPRAWSGSTAWTCETSAWSRWPRSSDT